MDKKTAAAAVLTVLFFGGVTAGSVFLFLKPSGESGARAPAGSMFPASRPGSTADAAEGSPSVQKIPPPSDWGSGPRTPPPIQGAAPTRSGGGSLGFIKKDESFLDGDNAEKSAREAAAKGDAKALVEGLQKSRSDESSSLSDDAIRGVMQKVVDKVKRDQPLWYKQFLGNRGLKAIADRYDKDKDFGTFVRLLSKNTQFKSMLKLKSKKPALRELTWSLLGDDSVGPSLKRMLFEKRDDPHLISLLKNYGAGAGVPAEMLEQAGIAVQASSQAKSRRSPRSKPTLQKRGFDGFQGKAPQGDAGGGSTGQNPALPPGVDPAMLEHYKKYMKK